MYEIKEKMKKEKGFRGVFMSDNLPKKMKRFENSIVNLDTSDSLRNGTHWVCYYNDPKYQYTEYFDPFGEYICNKMKLKEHYIPETI